MVLLLSIFINFWLFTAAEDLLISPTPSVQKKCPRFEEWSDCAPSNYICGPHCPPSRMGMMCPMYCKEGCVCKPGLGLIRDIKTGRCIYEKFCAALGDNNVVFSSCKADDQVYCPVFPLHPIDPLPKEIKCGCECTPGYVCKDGYVKNSTGYCVLPEQCDVISVE